MRLLKPCAILLSSGVSLSQAFGFSSSLRPFNHLSRTRASYPSLSGSLHMSTYSMYNPDKEYTLVLDDFAVRQFNNPEYTGTQVHYDLAKFETQINEYFASGK